MLRGGLFVNSDPNSIPPKLCRSGWLTLISCCFGQDYRRYFEVVPLFSFVEEDLYKWG